MIVKLQRQRQKQQKKKIEIKMCDIHATMFYTYTVRFTTIDASNFPWNYLSNIAFCHCTRTTFV